jgi:integrase/recombinase XerD
LRTDEIQQLFDNMTLLTPADLRTYAMVHIAYTMGLRPQEICKLTLDDIQFSKAEMHIRDRKASSPITLPIPPKTLKAIAAYLVEAVRKINIASFSCNATVPTGLSTNRMCPMP